MLLSFLIVCLLFIQDRPNTTDVIPEILESYVAVSLVSWLIHKNRLFSSLSHSQWLGKMKSFKALICSLVKVVVIIWGCRLLLAAQRNRSFPILSTGCGRRLMVGRKNCYLRVERKCW